MPGSADAGERGERLNRGLNLQDVDTTTAEEITAFRGQLLAGRNGVFMHPLTGYSVMLNHRPDMVKMHLRQMEAAFPITGEGTYRILGAAAMFNYYASVRYGDGIIHEIRALQSLGASKAQVQELMAIASLHCGPAGLSTIYHAAAQYLDSYVEPSVAPEFPQGWAPDVAALASGMDFDRIEMSEDDRAALFAWYESTLGEVPRTIRFLDRYEPEFLKSWRGKLERSLRGHLPKQLLPYIMIHYSVNLGRREALREAVLWGRAWGMSKAQVVHAIKFATGYVAGVEALYSIDESVTQLLEADW